MTGPATFRDALVADGGRLVFSPPQEVGVFGVDSSGRINLWNDAAARVTGALSSKNNKNTCLQECNEDEDEEELEDRVAHNNVDDETDDGSSRRVFGMSFEDLFPASVFESAGTQHQPTSITLVDVLDKVVQTGEPSMGVPVIGKAGRKRGRDEMTDHQTANATIVFSSFSVDFLPQFKSCPMFVSSRNVSGVILMCRSEPVRCIHNTIDMARRAKQPGRRQNRQI